MCRTEQTCRGKIFWKINKRAGWKFSGKSIILQVILIFETEKVIVNFILNFNATQINVEFFLKINKCADQNKAVQGGIFSQN